MRPFYYFDQRDYAKRRLWRRTWRRRQRKMYVAALALIAALIAILALLYGPHCEPGTSIAIGTVIKLAECGREQ